MSSAWPRRFINTMELNKFVFGALAAGCLGTAAAGGFVAARHGSSSVAPLAAPVAVTAPDSTTAKPVAESEGVITPEAPLPAPSAVAVAPVNESRTEAASRRRAEAPAPPAAARRPETRSTPTRSTRNDPPARTPAATAPTAPAPTTTASSGRGSVWDVRPAVEPERAPATVEPEAPAAPATPETIELVVPSDAVLGLQVERTITSETARVEDRVEARVTRDVRVGNRVAIPAGSVVQGSVMEVERGGKIRERARLEHPVPHRRSRRRLAPEHPHGFSRA